MRAMRRIGLAMASVLAVAAVPRLHADTVSVAADAQTHANQPDVRFGTAAAMSVRQRLNGSIIRSHARFDLSRLPPGADVQNAILRLWVVGVSNPGVVELAPIVEPWQEENITGASAPALGATVASFTVDAGDAQHFIEVDITGLAQDWASGVVDNHGLALRGVEGSTVIVTFDTKESTQTSHPPELEVALGSVGPQGPPGPTGPAGDRKGRRAARRTGSARAGGRGRERHGHAGTRGSTTGAARRTGSAGARGRDGSAGHAGTRGKHGTARRTGSAGARGRDGSAGGAGTRGKHGAARRTGSAGARGRDGSTGPTGSARGPGSGGTAGASGRGVAGGRDDLRRARRHDVDRRRVHRARCRSRDVGLDAPARRAGAAHDRTRLSGRAPR